MRWVATLLTLGLVVGLASADLAAAQSEVEMKAASKPGPRFEIVPPGPATREATRPTDADFYREDVRVRHEPAFIEPFVGRTRRGNEIGLSGWTSPNPPVGSLASQGYGQSNGWFSLGITFLFDYPTRPTARPVSAPR
jgi:hypothetical protein